MCILLCLTPSYPESWAIFQSFTVSCLKFLSKRTTISAIKSHTFFYTIWGGGGARKRFFSFPNSVLDILSTPHPHPPRKLSKHVESPRPLPQQKLVCLNRLWKHYFIWNFNTQQYFLLAEFSALRLQAGLGGWEVILRPTCVELHASKQASKRAREHST